MRVRRSCHRTGRGSRSSRTPSARMTASWRFQRRTRVRLFDGEPRGTCSPHRQSTDKSFRSHLSVPNDQRSATSRERNGQTITNDDQFSFQVWPFRVIHRERERMGVWQSVMVKGRVTVVVFRHWCSLLAAFPRILILQTHDIPPSSPPSLQSSPPSPRPRRRPPLFSLPTLPLTTQSCTCHQSLSQCSVL